MNGDGDGSVSLTHANTNGDPSTKGSRALRGAGGVQIEATGWLTGVIVV
jgi:hypothetical protein